MKALLLFFCLIGLTGLIPIKSQESGYIMDSDGYTNLRLEPSGNSEIIGIITSGQEFNYFPDDNSDWWKVEFKFRTGYMHKSRIKDFKEVKTEIRTFFQDFYTTNRNNAELSEVYNEKLFLLTQDFPLATLTAFCELRKEEQQFLISEYKRPIHDLIDLQLIFSRLISVASPCSENYKIMTALKDAAANSRIGLKYIKTFTSKIPDFNRPDKNPTISNKWFAKELDGKPITYYLNHSEIDTYAKMFYQGQFSVSDDTLTFAFLDSVLTSNPETKAFYFHIFNSTLRVTDGALSESIGSECRTYLEMFPCDFIRIKDNGLYQDNYKKWIDFAAYEYYFEAKPIETINNKINLISQKVMSDCTNQARELENIKTRLIEFIKENE